MSDPGTANFETVQPQLLRLRLGILACFAALLLIAVGVLLIFGNTPVRLITCAAALLATLVCSTIAWLIRAELKHYRFKLLDDGLLLHCGMWWRSEIFVPRVRIQHTDVAQGPLARRMGLATLVLHTAGVKQAQLDIVGLAPERARQLRDELLVRELKQDQPVVEPPA